MGNKNYKNYAIIETFCKLFGVEKLANSISENDPEFTINKVRESGIILFIKNKKDIEKDDIRKMIKKSMRELIESDIETFKEDISDKHEFEFDKELICADLIKDHFDIKIDKKYIYVDIER